MGTPTELKNRYMKGQLLLVECEPLGPGLEALRGAPGVLDAAVFGSSLHAVVADAQAALPKVREVLEAGLLRVGRLEEIPPILEDVFVSLTASRESKQGKAA
jgi:ABC-2 type transport system ATP-binding protein